MGDHVYITIIAVLLGGAWLYRRRKKSQLRKAEEEREQIETEEHRMFDFLHGLGEALTSENTSNSAVLHRMIVQGVTMVAEAHGGALYLLDHSDDCLVPQYCSVSCPPLIPVPAHILEQSVKRPSALSSYLRMTSIERTAGIFGRCLEENAPIRIDNLLAEFPARDGGDPDENFGSSHEGVAVMLAPLRYGDKTLGVLAVANGRMGVAFSANDFDVFRSVSEQSAFSLGTAMIHQEAAEKRRLESELETAREVQNILLPEHAPHLSDYAIEGTNLPAKVVSGDYYDYVPIDSTHYGVLIADVSGKGVPASLIMAMCRSVIRAHALDNHSPAAVLSAANRMLFPDMRLDMFISIAYLVLDCESNKVRLARAGHDAPFLFRSSDQSIEELSPPGLAIGIDSGDVFERSTRDHVFEMNPGDVIMLYTDGVNEALDIHGEEFGVEAMRKTLARTAQGGAKSVISGMTAAIREFAGTQPQNDDITLIAVEKR